MPRVAEFAGIIIWMYARDHQPPHLHAQCAESWAKYAIADGSVIAGEIPRAKDKLVRDWITAHRGDLERNWSLIEAGMQPERIG